MAKFTVNSKLNHNNEEYAPGSTVEMTAKEAEGLVQDGVVEPVEHEEKKPAADKKEPEKKDDKKDDGGKKSGDEKKPGKTDADNL